MIEGKVYNFTVNIELDSNKKAVFTYFQDGQQVSGGGIVTERNSLGIYTLNEETQKKGFLFSAATFSNHEGDCAKDFSYEVTNAGTVINISDTDENSGTACMIFTVSCNGEEYQSEDPQFENKEEV